MLVVFAGLPGTGKTTLSRPVAAHLRAALLRIDAIEAAVVRTGLATPPVGPIGYAAAHDLAADCLRAGTPVVVDAVNPVPEARAGWVALATAAGVPLRTIETAISDVAEHRRRVEGRRSDLAGHEVPTWAAVAACDYQPWDEQRDGPRLCVDTASGAEDVLPAVFAYLSAG